MLDRYITQEVADSLRRPPGEGGSCLPNGCYTDPAWLELENERLFARSWMYAGSLDNIPGPGDIFPTTVGNRPVVLVHGHDGTIRAFHNVCRHRGAILVEHPCRRRRHMTCPYHAWSYGLDGALMQRPHFDGAGRHDRPAAGPGLVEIRLARFHRAIFINLDGQAEPFADYIAPLARRLAGHDLDSLRLAKTLTWEFRANWKLVFENYFDTYHVFAIHPRLDAFAPSEGRQGFGWEEKLLHMESTFDEPEPGRGVGLPYYPGLAPGLERLEAAFHLFPSCCYQIWPDQLTVFQVFPVAPDHTIEHLHVFLIGDAARDPEWEVARHGVYDMWDELNREDVNAIEWMQKGRQSPAFDGGVLAPCWDSSHQHFARLVVETMA
ncbi:MAG: aromatic ring-hydroxylating dioxygenase subunit alpha [bacterium]|nr:aromatic ring-hydroxylating dioxygenase subunit alpha [bacterium]